MRKTIAALLAAMMLMVAAPVTADAKIPQKPTEQIPAIPGDDTPADGRNEPTGDEMLDAAIDYFKHEYGVSEKQARENLRAEGTLLQWADKIQNLDGYGDFRLERDERGVPSGVLTMREGDELALLPANVEQRTSKMSMLEGREYQDRLTERIGQGVAYYSPFDDSVKVWVEAPSSTAEIVSRQVDIAGAIRSLGEDLNFEVQEYEPSGDLNRGNQRLTHNTSSEVAACTTTAGVKRLWGNSWQWGVMTAGHCESDNPTNMTDFNLITPSGSSIAVWGYNDLQSGGYRDKVIYRLSGSSPKIAVSVNNLWGEDFAYGYTHPAVNMLVCMLGRNTHSLFKPSIVVHCREIDAANVPFTVDNQSSNLFGVTYHTYEIERIDNWGNFGCVKGDSGAAYWSFYGPYAHKRLTGIHSANSVNDDDILTCNFLSAKDQVYGPWGATGGWSYQ